MVLKAMTLLNLNAIEEYHYKQYRKQQITIMILSTHIVVIDIISIEINSKYY
jgi:hypothetical protein